MIINSIYVDNIIQTALLEDINYLDAATDYLIDEDQENTARFLAKADGVLCGIDVALRVFTLLQPQGFEAKVYKHDGDVLERGDIIAEIRGRTRTLLKGERTALNLLQHMSGVATATRRAADIVAGTNASIADTRKTLPGLRPLQKYAVTVGGGRNHRFNLSDAAMLKDNHVDAGGGITNAVAKLKAKLGCDHARQHEYRADARGGRHHQRQSAAGGERRHHRRNPARHRRNGRGHYFHGRADTFRQGV